MNVSSTVPVSVVIPTYNRANIVSEAIDSVLAQTYKNYEIIVVDDGSEDDTKTVLKKRYDGQIRYIYQPNRGPSAARNRGIRASKYDLIAFLDSDDIWLPQKLELQVPLIHDSKIVLSYTNWVDSKNDSGQDYFTQIGLSFNSEPAILDYPLSTLVRKGGSGILVPVSICRKDAIQRVGFFDERMKIAEDIRLWFRLASEGKFAVTSNPLAVRRWTTSGEQLTQPGKASYFKEAANMRLEIFMESYARAIESPPDVQQKLRNFISSSLADQAKYCALDRHYNIARRRALESLAFLPRGKTALKALLTLICPQALHSLKKRKN